MQLKVAGLVADGEVVAGHFGLGALKGHLVTGEQALIAQNAGRVDGGTGEVKVNIAAHVEELPLIGRLHLPALLSVGEKQR